MALAVIHTTHSRTLTLNPSTNYTLHTAHCALQVEDVATAGEESAHALESRLAVSEDERVRSKNRAKSMVAVLDAQITSLQEEYGSHVAATKGERTRLVAAFEKRVKALKESADRAYRTAETSGAKHSREMNSLRSSLAKDGYAVGELSKQLASTSSELAALKKREREYKLELAKAIAACRDAEGEQERTAVRLGEAETRANGAADEASAHKRRLADVAADHAALATRATAATATTAAVDAKVSSLVRHPPHLHAPPLSQLH